MGSLKILALAGAMAVGATAIAQAADMPLPPPPAAEGNPAQVAAEQADMPAAGDKGEDEPILNEADAAKQPVGNVKGDAAPASQSQAK